MAIPPLAPIDHTSTVVGDVASASPDISNAAVHDIVDIEGRLVARCSFLDDMPHGVMTAFNTSGQPAMEANYQFGKPHGVQRLYDEEGRLLQQTQRIGGLQHGLTTTYFPSGKVMLEQRHSAGVLDGESVTYEESGEVTNKASYVAGRLHGMVSYSNQDWLLRKMAR